jgi:hypothetical protein
LQLALAVEVVAQSFTLPATKVAGATAESFVSGEITWVTSYASVFVSFAAVGGAGMTGVNVDVAV